MVRRCCVTNCNGNYNPQNRVKAFRLPRNIEERKRWIAIIPRDNIPDTNNTVVCERHWPKGYLNVSDYGKLRPRDAPLVFSCIKPSLVPTVSVPLRKTSKSQ
ncbi:THAP domain-containing protein 2-like [Hydra vulgaris]|uniref:THAP domain-containing protein 2-like n=1 Tax=Hydra vulgaris TaxID=6087 RepID=UPI001F5F32AA|nr:THAP domain-containing protein 2-like [Hydra vulgaris]